ncbi:hypothetical protein [Paraburkholderia phytofirmans]|uniref:hypothetical protein n=1 Tax=Paraburkholderia phytofirmans TaxID=261302 RepID=UPI001EE66D06|nr:hypothetical protein [Paraburkholderia phytofirmans]
MIDIREGRRYSFLAARIDRQRQNQITAGLDEFEPPGEHLPGVVEAPKTIRMNEIKYIGRRFVHIDNVTLIHVPGEQLLDARKKTCVVGNRIAPGADIQADAGEVAMQKCRILRAPRREFE